MRETNNETTAQKKNKPQTQKQTKTTQNPKKDQDLSAVKRRNVPYGCSLKASLMCPSPACSSPQRLGPWIWVLAQHVGNLLCAGQHLVWSSIS